MKRLEELAARMICWKTPEESLKDRKRLLAQVMVFGTVQDLAVAGDLFAAAEFRSVIDDPPPGVFDPRSWAYWCLMYDKDPAQPLPKRRTAVSLDNSPSPQSSPRRGEDA